MRKLLLIINPVAGRNQAQADLFKMVVRPWLSSSREAWIRCSVTVSRAEVASSRIRILGFFKNTLAMDNLCMFSRESVSPL